jgi:DNA polymerase-3 subunit epsilon
MDFVAFDLETTGFLPGVDKLVEIGAVKFQQGQPVAVFATLIDPETSIPEGASRVNGITDAMVVGKPKIQTLLDPLAEFCGDLPMVAHNAPFDFQFLSADIKKFESRAARGPVLDTLALSRKLFPGLPNHKLGTLVEHLKIPATQFHRAEQDACYCGQLFWTILLRMGGEQGRFPPLENLIALCGKSPLQFPQIVPQPKQLGLF